MRTAETAMAGMWHPPGKILKLLPQSAVAEAGSERTKDAGRSMSPAARWHQMYVHIHILLTSTQKVDNVVPIGSGY